MTVVHFGPQTVASTVEAYVLSRKPNSMIVTSEAISSIRTVLPHCEHTDVELAELVAILAINRGRNVAFDRAEHSELSAVASPRAVDFQSLPRGELKYGTKQR